MTGRNSRNEIPRRPVFEPKREIYAQAAVIAREQGLPEDWLNDSVKGLLPDKVQPVEDTAEYLFATKAADSVAIAGMTSDGLHSVRIGFTRGLAGGMPE